MADIEASHSFLLHIFLNLGMRKGNRFYEFPSTSNAPTTDLSDLRRTKRRVEYKGHGDMWTYVGNAKRLPVQWTAWMSHTRQDPPSIEELQADLMRQQRVLQKAAIIEARDREELERIAAASAPPAEISPSITASASADTPSPIDISQPQGSSSATARTNVTDISQKQHDDARSKASDLPMPGRDSDWQPEAWNPQAVRRG
ncbi:hypothetical protein EW146_g8050 [Bondarzewia mesenterica]|uniref:NADH dehydrogenase [ubiquinone] 1 alpha subcomplex subunit n=1 Tax=Bondarzewia mesenterica TaxID=1095465 RepID=A0A4S4LI28_9AGAM|nr:hypothetical protein EW146_g8050 [Bondarzewia mesenterica]